MLRKAARTALAEWLRVSGLRWPQLLRVEQPPALPLRPLPTSVLLDRRHDLLRHPLPPARADSGHLPADPADEKPLIPGVEASTRCPRCRRLVAEAQAHADDIQATIPEKALRVHRDGRRRLRQREAPQARTGIGKQDLVPCRNADPERTSVARCR